MLMPSQSTHPKVCFLMPVAARLCYAALLLMTSIYCLLAYLPDTYYAFIQAPFQRWLPWFIRLHPYLYSVLVLVLCLSLLKERREKQSRRLAIEFVCFNAGATLYLLISRPFSHIGNNSQSYIWSLVLLVPVILIAGIDYVAYWRNPIASENWSGHLGFVPLLITAAAIGVLYPAMSFLRFLQMGTPFQFSQVDLMAWLAAICGHLILCAFGVSLVNLGESIGARTRNAARFRWLSYHLLAWFALQRLFQNVILATIPFNSIEAKIYSGMMALTLVMFFGALLLRRQKISIAAGATSSVAWTVRTKVALALALLAAAYIVPAIIGVVDWNFLLEKLWSLALWSCALGFLFVYFRVRRAGVYPIWLLVLIAVLSPLTYYLLFTPPTGTAASSPPVKAMTDAMLRHSYYNASFQVVNEIWTSPQQKPCDELCQFLLTQTNVPPSATVIPPEVNLVDQLSPARGSLPNVFILVVDSLRPDYLSTYNPAVHFTPEIAKFAAESTVMRKAFTRYAGTTLAEPSIWAGAMLLHKHYIQPFHPVNSLEKLLDTDGYQRFISVDTVLRLLLRPTPDLVRLDENVINWTDEDLCSTAADAESKISRLHVPGRPIFMYAQPQNIHGITLGHLPPERQPKKNYPGFNAVVASELERLDGCFGGFIRHLKSSGLYDNSIVILTADHGDAYGEFGRKGHGFEMNPSGMRIPLIVHLPSSMRSKYYCNPDNVAFNMDIPATLYYLLGHRPIVNDERFGRPLFTGSQPEASSYLRNNYLLVSSYGPLYGLLGNDGRTLFVSNALEGTNQYFDLVKDPGAVVNRLDDQTLAKEQQLTRSYVQQIADLYHFKPRRHTLAEWLLH